MAFTRHALTSSCRTQPRQFHMNLRLDQESLNHVFCALRDFEVTKPMSSLRQRTPSCGGGGCLFKPFDNRVSRAPAPALPTTLPTASAPSCCLPPPARSINCLHGLHFHEETLPPVLRRSTVGPSMTVSLFSRISQLDQRYASLLLTVAHLVLE